MCNLKEIISTLEQCIEMIKQLDEHAEMISKKFNVRYVPTFDKEDIINYIVEEILKCNVKDK